MSTFSFFASLGVDLAEDLVDEDEDDEEEVEEEEEEESDSV